MSGKPRNTSWGGARQGAGRKPKYMLTDYQVKKMIMAARKRARETGKTPDDILIGFIYGDEDATVKDRLSAIGIYKTYTMSKSSEQNINVTKQVGPKIGLPPMREDPALKIVKG